MVTVIAVGTAHLGNDAAAGAMRIIRQRVQIDPRLHRELGAHIQAGTVGNDDRLGVAGKVKGLTDFAGTIGYAAGQSAVKTVRQIHRMVVARPPAHQSARRTQAGVEGQRCHAAGHAVGGIAHDHRIAHRISQTQVGQGQRWGMGTGHVSAIGQRIPVFQPLITDRLGPGDTHGEGGCSLGEIGLVLWLANNGDIHVGWRKHNRGIYRS